MMWQRRSRAYTTTAPFFGRSKHLNENNSRINVDEPTCHWPATSSGGAGSSGGGRRNTRASCRPEGGAMRGAITAPLASSQGGTDWLQKKS